MVRKASAVAVAANPTRSRGRPKKTKAAAPTPIAIAQEPPKKRGRPPKADKAASAPSQGDDQGNAEPVGRRSRPRKEETTVKKAPASPKRTSPRAQKTAPVVQSSSVSKRRGRPAPTIKAAPRVDPHVRSKLRDRTQLLEAKKKAAAKVNNEVPARRGRPNGPKRGRGRPKKDATVPTAKTATRKVTRDAVTKQRARKGYITMEIPKKHVAQVQQYLLDLEANYEVPRVERVNGAVEEQVHEEIEIDVQEGAQEDLNISDVVNGEDKEDDEEINVQVGSQEELNTSDMLDEGLQLETEQEVQHMIEGEIEDQDMPNSSFQDT